MPLASTTVPRRSMTCSLGQSPKGRKGTPPLLKGQRWVSNHCLQTFNRALPTAPSREARLSRSLSHSAILAKATVVSQIGQYPRFTFLLNTARETARSLSIRSASDLQARADAKCCSPMTDRSSRFSFVGIPTNPLSPQGSIIGFNDYTPVTVIIAGP